MSEFDYKISQRLLCVASLIEKGSIVADIGTDHGYLPVYLAKSGISPKVIAMDLRKGPLVKAKANVEGYGVSDKVTLRLSDGLDELSEHCDVVTICGMGGKLIAKILTKGYEKLKSVRQIIVSAQSQVPRFRRYLRENGFVTAQERIIHEDGKYYFIMDCHIEKRDGCADKVNVQPDLIQDVYDMYGRLLLESRDKVLKEFLDREYKKLSGIREHVNDSASDFALQRVRELDYNLKCIEKGFEFYEMQ